MEKVGVASVRRTLAAAGVVLMMTTLIPQPATAATPRKITLSGGTLDHPIEITRPEDLDGVTTSLCTDARISSLAGRPSFEINITWTADLTWGGRLFPEVMDQPAAVDIPDWRLYVDRSPPRSCDRRVAGEEALRVLTAYGVPTTVVERRLPTAAREGEPSETIVIAAGTLAAFVVLVALLTVLRPRRR